MKTVKQKNVWIDFEVVQKLDELDPQLSPNNHLRKFLGMPLNLPRGRNGGRKKRRTSIR